MPADRQGYRFSASEGQKVDAPNDIAVEALSATDRGENWAHDEAVTRTIGDLRIPDDVNRDSAAM